MSQIIKSVFVKRYFYPYWWCLAWLKISSISRKIASLILFGYFISAFFAPFTILRHETGNIKYFLAVIPSIVLTWPFLLVISPPKTHRDGTPCCSGCGHIDQDLRFVEYRIGFALFGLMPISGLYKRNFCSVCRRYVYRIAVILQNLTALICFPVGTVMGIIWLFKNMNAKTINIDESIKILTDIKKECESQNDTISLQEVNAALNLLEPHSNKTILM